MRGTSVIATIFIIAAFQAQLDSHAQNTDGKLSPNEQLVVLKNGEILKGQVARNGQQVTVVTDQGSRLVLTSKQTDFVCNSFEDAYWKKSSRVRATDVEGQQRLFFWCLRNQLLDLAQNQIDVLVQSEIKATQLEYLDRQLNAAILQQTKVRQRLAREQKVANVKIATDKFVAQSTRFPDTSMTPASINLNTSIGKAKIDSNLVDTTAFRPLPSMPNSPDQIETKFDTIAYHLPVTIPESVQDSVRQVGFEEEMGNGTFRLDHRTQSLSPPSMSPAKSHVVVDDRDVIPNSQLDRETRSMPTGSLGHYRRHVERVLTNRCGKCHDSTSRAMPLIQVGIMQSIPRRQSQRNLHNILRYVDHKSPFDSPLLIAASTPHAGAEKPILKAGTEHLKNLRQWLVMLSENSSANAKGAVASNIQSNLSHSTNEESPRPLNGVVPIKPEPVGLAPLGERSDKFPVTIGEIPKLNNQKDEFTPMDAFDPEIFNRKYGGN